MINKAKEACNNVGQSVEDRFPDVRKMVALGSGSERDVDDFLHTRYGIQGSGARLCRFACRRTMCRVGYHCGSLLLRSIPMIISR